MRQSNRRGVYIGFVMIMVVVFAILGMALMSSGTSEYNQTAVAAYRMKAGAHIEAVLEEALAVLYDRLNRPYDDDPSNDDSTIRTPPAWKEEVFDAVRDAVEEGNTGIIDSLTKDLFAEDLIPVSSAIVTIDGGTVEECVVQFEGFRRLYYTQDGSFIDNDDLMYRDPFGMLDPPDKEILMPHDYIGYVTVKIRTAYGHGRVRVRRDHSATFDIKIVNQSPMAQEFAVFQMLPFEESQDDIVDDLNRGGGLHVFPAGRGRCYTAGPYQVNSYGVSDGTGGRRPSRGESYFRRRWHGWSLVPSPRAGVIRGSLGRGFPSPGRPGSRRGRRLFIDLGSFAADFLGISNIGYMLIGGSRRSAYYYCANRDSGDIGDRYFSLVGSPRSGDPDDVDTYAGIMARINENDISHQTAFDGGTWPSRSTDEPWIILPEGQLRQRANQANWTYRRWRSWGIRYERYRVNIAERDLVLPYAVTWMENFKDSLLGFLGATLFDGAMAFIGTVTFLDFVDMMGSFVIEMTHILIAAGVGTLGAIMQVLAGGDPVPGGGDLTGWSNFFPSNFRYEPMRAVTRRYHSLYDLDSYLEDQGEEIDGRPVHPVILDGSILIDDLSGTEYFNYLGKGTIISANPGREPGSRSPVIDGPILPAVQPFGSSPDLHFNDHLNLMYFGSGDPAQAHRGEDVLRIGVDPLFAGAGDLTAAVQAAVFSSQGVAPAEDGQDVDILGNYVNWLYNKHRIPDNSILRVRYNAGFRPDDDDLKESFRSSHWYNVSMSFRPSGWYDRLR